MTTTTTLLTTEDAKRLLEEIAAERGPDFVYLPWRVTEWTHGDDVPEPVEWEHTEPGNGNCQYRHPETGEPDCIVGHLAARLDRLDDVEENLIADNQRWLSDVFDHAAVQRIRYVQIAQDAGLPWGKAIEIGFGKDDDLNVMAAIRDYRRAQEQE